MIRRRSVFDQRRVLSRAEVTLYLGKSVTWLSYHGDELLQSGFPQPLPIVGGYDKQAIDGWIDGLGQAGDRFDFDAAWTKAANGYEPRLVCRRLIWVSYAAMGRVSRAS
jgi:hypothetical protein